MALLQQQRQQKQLKLEKEISDLKEKNRKEKNKETVEKLKQFFIDIRDVMNGGGDITDEVIRAKIVPLENLQPSKDEEDLKKKQAGEDEMTEDREEEETDDNDFTSIDLKLDSGKYNYDVYALYHDLKLAIISNLITYPIGSEKYVLLNDFFKFISDCIFREAVQLGILEEYKGGDSNKSGEKSRGDNGSNGSTSGVASGKDTGNDSHDSVKATGNSLTTNGTSIKSETNGRVKAETKILTPEEYFNEERDRFESDIFNGFKKIYSDVIEFYGEAYYIVGQHGPIFSSLTGKSPIDPRETITKGLFNTLKVLPPTKTQTGPYHLMFVSPLVAARIPHPSVPPSELLQFYVHPTQAPLPSTRWLKYDSYSSFAPSSDDFATVLKKGSSSSVWLDKVGLPIAEEEAAKREQDEYENESDDEDEDDEDEEEEEGSEEEEEGSNEEEGDGDIEMKDVGVNGATPVKSTSTPPISSKPSSVMPSSTSGSVTPKEASAKSPAPANSTTLPIGQPDDDGINVLRVLEWSPASFIDDDEIEAAANGTESELVSWLLLELQNLQRERLSKEDNSAFIISEIERRLALKIQNILARIVGEVTPKDVDLSLSHLLPVLQTNYMGTLPGPPEPKPNQAGRSSARTPSRQIRTKK